MGLSNIVPGLRDVRAPLIAGYLWLLCAWVALDTSLPTRRTATGAYAAVLDLRDVMSEVGVAVVLSVVAYLVGTVSEGISNGYIARSSTFGGFLYTQPYGPRGDRTLRDLAARTARETAEVLPGECRLADVASGSSSGELAELSALLREARNATGNVNQNDETVTESDWETDLAEALRQRVVDELDLLRTRLLGAQIELFSTIDRLQAEADLRFAIAPPLIALSIVFTVRNSVFYLVGLLAVVVLFRQARTRLRSAGDMLIDSLLVGATTAPTLERLQREVPVRSAGLS